MKELPYSEMEKSGDKLKLKKLLLEECFKIQNQLVANAKQAMLLAQESANDEKGKMGDKFESFREQCQIDRDMFAKQLQEALGVLDSLTKLNITKENKTILPGSVLMTDVQNIFVSASVGKIEVEGKNYFAISTGSPIYKSMVGKVKGETFTFRDKVYKISETF